MFLQYGWNARSQDTGKTTLAAKVALGLNALYNEGHLAVHSDIATFLPMDGK